MADTHPRLELKTFLLGIDGFNILALLALAYFARERIWQVGLTCHALIFVFLATQLSQRTDTVELEPYATVLCTVLFALTWVSRGLHLVAASRVSGRASARILLIPFVLVVGVSVLISSSAFGLDFNLTDSNFFFYPNFAAVLYFFVALSLVDRPVTAGALLGTFLQLFAFSLGAAAPRLPYAFVDCILGIGYISFGATVSNLPAKLRFDTTTR
jgi:hypothetical protein